MRPTARKLAFDSLKKCMRDGKYSNLEVTVSLDRSDLDGRDRGLYTALVYGVIEKSITLDFVITEFSRTPIAKLDPDVLILLRLGIYQILFADKIPDFSACDETVKLSRPSSKSFVNAILRQTVKNKDAVLEKVSRAGLSVKYSVPQWIIDLWISSYGEGKTLDILEGFSKRPNMTIRVNTLRITADALLEKIRESGVECTLTDTTDVISVSSGSPEKLYGFAEGLFFVQGVNSRKAVASLELKKGERVIDVCACPGGKTFSAAIDMENEGEIFSFDLHKNKLPLIAKGGERLGITIVNTGEQNAAYPREELFYTADAVICDVPCSGLGIIANKPDIKYKSPEDIKRLPEVQFAILSASSKYLKKGGRLLYSTCTLNKGENEDVSNRFLTENPDFHRVEGFPSTAFPSADSDDGFFFDLIIKD